MSFLDLNSTTPKSKVYISITPGVGIELIQLDMNTNTVANYAMREVTYSESQRDIADYDNFKNAVASMYEELKINPKTHVVVNMPLVSFGVNRNFGLLVPDDAITEALKSEIETGYIFQKSEPIVDWKNMPKTALSGDNERTIVYSAIQKSVVDNIAEKLSELGSTLDKVENSLSCTFRALQYLGATVNQMQPDVTWNLMILSSVGYSVISMSGRNVVDYYEEAIAIKTFDEDEVYDAIAQSAKIALSSYPANYLYVVSDTDLVSAQVLVSRLNVMGTVDFIENNSFKTQDSLMPVSLEVLQNYTRKISLQAIGCALSDVSDFPLNFNYMGNVIVATDDPSCTIPIGEHEYTITKSAALKLAGIISIVLILIAAIPSFLIIPKLVSSESDKAKEMEDLYEKANSEYKEVKGEGDITTFDLKREVEMGVKGNRAKLMNYVAAGDSIPQDVWLTYFYTEEDGLLDIKGCASDVSSVYVFFKNMRDSLIGTKLKLQNLEMTSKSVDAAVAGVGANYTFEITNMDSHQLEELGKAWAEETTEEGKEGDNNNSSSDNSAPSSDLIGTEPIEE